MKPIKYWEKLDEKSEESGRFLQKYSKFAQSSRFLRLNASDIPF
jgi:hypothetical protein